MYVEYLKTIDKVSTAYEKLLAIVSSSEYMNIHWTVVNVLFYYS
jgi:hypothetical protein